MTSVEKASSAVFSVNFHIVWCTKYRRPILVGDIKDDLEKILATICDARSWSIIDVSVMPDHIHLFMSGTPFERPMDIVKILKGVSAKQMFQRHPEIRSVLRHGTIWSPSYYLGTAGQVSGEIISRYIQNQAVEDGRRRDSSPG